MVCILTLGPAGVQRRGKEGGAPPGPSPPPTTSTHKFRVSPKGLLRTGPVPHPSPWALLGPTQAPWPRDPWLQVGVAEPSSSGLRLTASLPTPLITQLLRQPSSQRRKQPSGVDLGQERRPRVGLGSFWSASCKLFLRVGQPPCWDPGGPLLSGRCQLQHPRPGVDHAPGTCLSPISSPKAGVASPGPKSRFSWAPHAGCHSPLISVRGWTPRPLPLGSIAQVWWPRCLWGCPYLTASLCPHWVSWAFIPGPLGG